MTLKEAESARHELQTATNKVVHLRKESIEVFIVPSQSMDYEAFYKQWRSSTYVTALAAFGHCNMTLVVCDNNFADKEFETVQEFLGRIGFFIGISK